MIENILFWIVSFMLIIIFRKASKLNYSRSFHIWIYAFFWLLVGSQYYSIFINGDPMFFMDAIIPSFSGNYFIQYSSLFISLI
ncbi:hypothetical protein, partial [Vibrio anguillarum]|uniref:hypothetical protein n=2 Tax=Vibrio anguillarum TaxID=55601 RepID=UPI001BE47AA3